MVISANKIHQQADWTDRRLADLAAFEKGHVVTYQSDSVTGSRPYIGADSFTGVFNQFTMDSSAVLCEPTDVLMLWDGERSGLCATGLCGAIGSTVTRLRPKIGIDGRFLYHQLARHFAWIQARRTGTGIPHVPKDIGNTLFLSLPSDPAEQSRIAAVLDTVDEAIAKTEAVIAKLKQVRVGLLHDLLTRGLDENGQLRDPIAHPEQFQDSPIGRIPRGWLCEPIGKHTVSSAYGPRFPGECYSERGNVALLRTTDMDEAGNLALEKMPLADLILDEFRSHFLEVGDFIISRSGTCGIGSVFPGFRIPVLPGAFLIRFRLAATLLPDFLRLYVNSEAGAKRVSDLAEGGVQKNIRGSALLAHLIPVPPTVEQKAIFDCVQPVDAKTAVEQTSLGKLQQLKSALMTDLLTGRVRVPDDLDLG